MIANLHNHVTYLGLSTRLRNTSLKPSGTENLLYIHFRLQDPTSLVAWMNIFFGLADAGMTSFDVNGPCWPHCQLNKIFGDKDARGLYEGTEKLLGTFKRR